MKNRLYIPVFILGIIFFLALSLCALVTFAQPATGAPMAMPTIAPVIHSALATPTSLPALLPTVKIRVKPTPAPTWAASVVGNG
jgi:hypothetical protein